jgi:hypothetical protein
MRREIKCAPAALFNGIARLRLTGKMAHDDLVCPPPVPPCHHPARRSGSKSHEERPANSDQATDQPNPKRPPLDALRFPGNQLEDLMKANRKITIAAIAGIVLGALTIIISGNAAMAQDTVRVRGTVESIDGPTYVIKTRDGDELKVALPDKAQIAAVVKASLADIKQGLFVGVTAMPQADGSLRALEVHIFPEAMRGTGEGHYSWDLRPQSTMTNANVDQVVTAVDGQTLTLKYKNGEKKIFVAADTPIVAYVRGDNNDLRTGAKVFIAAIKQPDGTLQGRAWRVGRDGVTPPM